MYTNSAGCIRLHQLLSEEKRGAPGRAGKTRSDKVQVYRIDYIPFSLLLGSIDRKH